MKPRNAIFLLFVAATLAASAAAAQHTPDSLRIDCRSLRRPSQGDVARVLGIRNFSQAYAARERVMQIVRRKCLRRVGEVEIVVTSRDLHQTAPEPSNLVTQQ